MEIEISQMLEQQGALVHPYFLPLFLLFLLLLFVSSFNTRPRTKKYNLPPSLPKFPIIGNLHQIGSLPHRTFRSLAQRHGPLILLHLGSIPTLVVSSADAAQEIMKTHDLIFATRPDSSFARRLLYQHKDLAFSPYGEYWRQIRRITVLQLLSTKRVQQFRSVREEEITLLVEKIQRSCSSSPSCSALLDLRKTFPYLTNDIICRVALGKKYSEDDGGGRRFQEMIDELAALLGVANLEDFIPSLAWVNYINGLNKRVDKNFADWDSFLDQVIEDHIHGKVRKKEGGKPDDGGEDFVEFLLQIDRDNTAGVTLGSDGIKALVMDMFAAGTDTTQAVLEWAMAEILRHPEVMKEAQEEVRAITRGRRNITEDDLHQLHYLKLVIKETLRLHPPGPMLVPREATKDIKIQGYDILAKTRVIINAWAIGRDPMLWEEAETFKPSRFLNAASGIDFRGHNFQLLPFGAGRRGCPATEMANLVAELTLANLLDKFDWELPDGASGKDLDMTEKPGLTIHIKCPLLAVAKPHYF